jgi:hypothetical protein
LGHAAYFPIRELDLVEAVQEGLVEVLDREENLAGNQEDLVVEVQGSLVEILDREENLAGNQEDLVVEVQGSLVEILDREENLAGSLDSIEGQTTEESPSIKVLQDIMHLGDLPTDAAGKC